MSYGFNNNHHMAAQDIAAYHFDNGIPYAHGKGNWPDAHQGGVYRDAVYVHGDLVTWLYHGNPIAQRNVKTGEKKFSSCGWETSTTKQRLWQAGAKIYQHLGVWYSEPPPHTRSKKRLAEVPLWKDDQTMELHHPGYVRYDAWRGHHVPLTVVCGASNTGGWSDSPYRPEEEIKGFRDHLTKNKIRSTLCWSATSNVFCTKVWIQVHPKWFDKACELWSIYDAEKGPRLLHSA
jgi:hypothetical protein